MCRTQRSILAVFSAILLSYPLLCPAAIKPAPLYIWFTDVSGPPDKMTYDPRKQISNIALDIGIGERESFWVYLTPNVELSYIDVSLSNLRSTKGTIIPPTHLRIRQQQGFRLEDFARLPHPKKGHTYCLWFTLAPKDAPPGTYRGNILFDTGGAQQLLPLVVRIWNVHKPPTARVGLEPYSAGMGILNDYPAIQQGDAKERAIALMHELGEGGGDRLEIFLNPATFLNDVKVRETQTPVWTTLVQSPHIFQKQNLPGLDFSCYDEWIDHALQAGLVRCAIHVGDFIQTFLPLLQRLSGKELEPGTPECERYTAWLWKEFRDYLKSRGYPEVWVKISDEISPDDMKHWLTSAALAQKAGLKPYCTWTGFLARQKGAIAQINPYCDHWQIQVLSLHNFCKIIQKDKVVDFSDEIWTYGGGSQPYRLSYSAYRQYGWYVGYYGLDGLGFWTYFWGTAEEQVVYVQRGQVISTPAWEGVKDGMDDAEYFTLLRAMIKQSRRRVQQGMATPAERQALQIAEAESQKLIGTTKGCFLLLKPDEFRYGKSIVYPWYSLANPSTPNFRTAKARLLKLISLLQSFYRPSVFYGETPIVKEGKVEAIITCNEKVTPGEQVAIKSLQEHIYRLSGVRVPVKVMDDLSQEEKIQTLIQIGKPALEWRWKEYGIPPPPNNHLPRQGNYILHNVPNLYNLSRRVIIIAGADDTGTLRGEQNFQRLLKQR